MPALRGQLASCLCQMGSLDNALEECDRAIESAPDHAEFYRSRAFIRASRGETRGLVEDLRQFELLGQSFEESFYRDVKVRGMGDHRRAGVPTLAPPSTWIPRGSLLPASRTSDRGASGHRSRRARRPVSRWPRDLQSRYAACSGSGRSGGRVAPRSTAGTASEADALAIAANELDKVLAVSPGHIVARMTRMMDSLEDGRIPRPRTTWSRSSIIRSW